MKHIKKIKIDIDKNNFEVIPSVQYDSNTRYLHINLLNGSVPFDITGCSVKISGTKPDGTAIFNNCTVVNAKEGFVEVELTEQMNAAPGTVKCELKLYDGNGVLTTKQFYIEVSASVTSKSITSSNEFKALEEALSKVNNIDTKFESLTEAAVKEATEKEIQKQIASGNMANLTIANGSITKEKLDPSIEFGVKENSITRKEINDDLYKEIDGHRVTGSYSSSNWIQIMLKNDKIISVGTVLNISFSTIGFKGVNSGTTGVYNAGTLYTNEFSTTEDNYINQVLTFNKEYTGNISIIFHPNIIENSNMFILEDLTVNDYEILSVGVFQKKYPYEKISYYDDTLITRKDVDKKLREIVLPDKSVGNRQMNDNSVDKRVVAKNSLSIENLDPTYYKKYDGIHVKGKASYLRFVFDISNNPIKIGDSLSLSLTILDNIEIDDRGDSYNSLSLSPWGNEVDTSTTSATRNLVFTNIKHIVNNSESFCTYTATSTSTVDTSKSYLCLYATVVNPLSENGGEFKINNIILRINDIELAPILKDVFNSPSATYEELDYLPEQLMEASLILEEIKKAKDEAISEAISRAIRENCWLWNKKMIVMGDSLSDIGVVTPQKITNPSGRKWQGAIAYKYNMTLESRASSGGSLSNAHGPNGQLPNMVMEEPDLIVTWIGTNDAQPGNTIDEVYNKIESFIITIYEKYPHSRLFFITPLANQKTSNPQEEPDDGYVWTYVQGMKKVCRKYSIPCLDLYSNSNLNPHLGDINDIYYIDGDKCHMNTKGYDERITPIIEQFLINQR